MAPLAHDSDEYLAKLGAAFFECGRHDLAKLKGHWVAVVPPVGDVWLCGGSIRWKADSGGVSDICVIRPKEVEGGVDAEAVYHEDLHDPGDASGLYLFLRYDGQQLTVDAADWEEPENRSQFFVLKRNPDSDDPPDDCPLR